jgi:hypothetical protein
MVERMVYRLDSNSVEQMVVMLVAWKAVQMVV